LVQRLPQFGTLHRLLGRRTPAIALPALDPAGYAVLDVVAVRIEIDGAGLLQRPQRRARRHQFHAVVGRGGLAARKLPGEAVEAQYGTPAARARIARA